MENFIQKFYFSVPKPHDIITHFKIFEQTIPDHFKAQYKL